MNPGRELDARIAERVMGMTFHRRNLDINAGNIVHQEGWYKPGQYAVKIDLPFYSTDIEAAWEVVEKLKTIPGKPEDWGTDFDKPFPIQISFQNCKWVVEWSPAYWIGEFQTEADTAPHAICLAALRALEGK